LGLLQDGGWNRHTGTRNKYFKLAAFFLTVEFFSKALRHIENGRNYAIFMQTVACRICREPDFSKKAAKILGIKIASRLGNAELSRQSASVSRAKQHKIVDACSASSQTMSLTRKLAIEQ